MMRLLLLEDDIGLLEGLSYALGREGYTLTSAQTVSEALKLIDSGVRFDLLLLDVTLPDGTGFSVCEHVRNAGNTVPILFLTASDEELSIVRGLDSGGDDYMTKPFKLLELLSRIRALLRRAAQTPAVQPGRDVLLSGGICIELAKSRAIWQGAPLELTRGEYRLLCLLVENANQTVTRAGILDALWDGGGSFVDDNTLSVYMRRLREKLEADPSSPQHLITVRGFGYQWRE